MTPTLPKIRGILNLFLAFALHVSAAQALNLSLAPSASALWGDDNTIATAGGLIITGHPDGLRVWRKAGAGVLLHGQLEIPDGVRALAVQGNVVYGLDGAGHVFVANLADPANPANAGTFGPPQEWAALTVGGHLVLLAGTDSVLSFDIADPIHPTRADVAHYTGEARSIAAHDSLFAIGLGNGGLLTGRQHADASIDITGQLSCGNVTEIVTDGSYGWSPQQDSGVLVLDFTDTSLPAVLARFYTYGYSTHVALAGDRLLVADLMAGLVSYRLIIPPLPFWQSELNSLTGIEGLVAESASRFYAIRQGLAVAVDVDVAGRLSEADQFGHVGNYRSVLRHRNWMYVAGAAGIWRAGGSMPIADSSFVRVSSQAVQSAVLADGRLLSAEGQSGAALYRIDDAGSLELLSRIPALTSTGGVVFGHDTLMVLDSLYGFQIYDITNPTAPRYLGGRATDRQAPVAAINRNYLYLSEPHQGVAIWNWRFPSKPTRLGFLPHTSMTEGMLIDGRFLYVADSDSGISIFDVGVPSNPVTLGRILPPFPATALCLSGRLLYVGQSDGTVSAIDVLDSTLPVVLAETRLTGRIRGLSKHGERVWATTETAVRTVDVAPALFAGDFNADGFVDVFDVMALIGYCFSDGELPYRLNAADVDSDGQSNLIDIVLMIDYIFSGGPDLLSGTVE